MRTMCVKTAILGAAVLSVWSIPGASRADVQDAFYGDSEMFLYTIKHMPDLDQRRLLLPNQGAMYCVPTSSMNLFAYAANHGLPSLDPGAGNWQSDALYNTGTSNIDLLGTLMNTDPFDGTSGGHAALFAWLLANQAPLTAHAFYGNDTWLPKIQDLAKTAITTNSLIAFAYGRYPYFSGDAVVLAGARSGGHMVTLSHTLRTGPFITIGVRDPADESQSGLYLVTQSPFTTRTFSMARERSIFISGFARIGTILEFPPSGQNIAVIDAYFAIRPMQGFAWSPSAQLTLAIPFDFLGGSGASQRIIDLGASSTILDAVLGMEGDTAFVLVEGVGVPSSLVQVDLATETQQTIVDIPGASELAFGRKRELYVLLDGQVLCFDIDGGVKTPTASANLPDVGAALAYQDSIDQVIVLMPEARQIASFRSGLPAGAPPTLVNIPASVPMAGDGSVAVNPADGAIWFATDASDSIYNVATGVEGVFVNEISLPEIVRPQSLSFSDRGDLFVMTEKGLVQVRRNPLNGQWMTVEDPMFDGMIGPASGFKVSRSRTNFEPAMHGGPAWNNFEPAQNDELFGSDVIELDCDQDLNGDGRVDGADLASMLAAWGDCDVCLADTNGDRVINGADLADLLSAWGECGQLK